MKGKMVAVLGAIALVLAITSGSLAARKWIITNSSQVRPGSIVFKSLSHAAKKKLRGQRGPAGPPGTPGGPSGPSGPSGPPGPSGTSALAQFGGRVDHGQTQCLGIWGANKQGACLSSAFATDASFRVFGPMRDGMTIQDLSVVVAPAPDVASMVITVLDNGVATPLTCTIPKGNTSCSNDTDSFVTSAGDFIEVRVSNNASNTLSRPRFIVNFLY